MDNRVVYKQMAELTFKSKANIVLTLLLDLVIEILIAACLIYVLGLSINLITVTAIFVKVVGNIYNTERNTAARVRKTVITYTLNRMYKSIKSVFFLDTPWYTKKQLCNVFIDDMRNRYKKYRYQWSELDQRYMKKEKNKIADYWEQRGLNDAEIKKRTCCIRFTANEPMYDKEFIQDTADIADIVGDKAAICKRTKNWTYADMSDEAHVKSIYKRLCSPKIIINLKSIDDMEKVLDDTLTLLEKVKYTDEELIRKAIASDGSAGQFAKRSQFEGMWKASTSEESPKIWKGITEQIFRICYLTNELPDAMIEYMLYRKREAITKNDEGVAKETRLMNSPNLVARICDSVSFGNFNEAVVLSRFVDSSSIGMNIFVEMKLIMNFNPFMVTIASDFKDYDGSQHPGHGFQIGITRLKYMRDNDEGEHKMGYMATRYEKHMNRVVNSTSGMSYHTIGQQASGDITTSDDNTLKTKSVCTRIVTELIEKGMIEFEFKKITLPNLRKSSKVNLNITSDDQLINVTPTPKWDPNQVASIFDKKSVEMGWAIKEGSFFVAPMDQRGGNEYLSHHVKRRSVYSRHFAREYRGAFVTRPIDRAYGKWRYSAELDKSYSRANKAKMVSKYLTTMATSIGNPELIFASAHALYALRSSCGSYKQSYSWQGVTAKTIGDIDLNTMIELQFNVMLDDEIEWIEITREEKSIIEEIVDDFKHAVYKDVADGQIPKIKWDKEWELVHGNACHYRGLCELLVKLYTALSSASRLAIAPDTKQWWDTKQVGEGLIITKETRQIGGVVNCGHIDTPKLKGKRGIYRNKFVCEECFNKNIEKYYHDIVMMVKEKDIKEKYLQEIN